MYIFVSSQAQCKLAGRYWVFSSLRGGRDCRGVWHWIVRRAGGMCVTPLYLAGFSSRLWSILWQSWQSSLSTNCPWENSTVTMKGWVKTQWASLTKAFICTHHIREVNSCLSSAPAEITELRESCGCLRPLFFCSLEYSISLRISPWENNSQIASVMEKKITSPSVYQLMYILLLVDLNRNHFITEMHFFGFTCPCRMNLFSESSFSQTLLFFPLLTQASRLLHLITVQSCRN